MKIIVTGGTGFIGRHLIAALLQLGHEIVSIDHADPHSPIDIRDRSRLMPAIKEGDCLFHLAAVTAVHGSSPRSCFDVNLSGTLNLLEAAHLSNVKRFIFAASASCYGNAQEIPITERSPLIPLSPYALSKVCAEKSILEWGKKQRVATVSLRLFNVYGKGGTKGVVHDFLADHVRGTPLSIEGAGSQTRDFIHVQDAVAAFIAAIEAQPGEIFNVGTGIETAIATLASFFKSKHIFKPRRANEINRSCAEISKIKRNLGWNPKIGLEEGIKKLVESKTALPHT